MSSVLHRRHGDVAGKSVHRLACVDAKIEMVAVVELAADVVVVVAAAEGSAAQELEVLLSFFGDLS